MHLDDRTALILATKIGHGDIVKYLIEVKADVDIQAEDGGTALILDAQNAHRDVVKYLIQSKAVVNM